MDAWLIWMHQNFLTACDKDLSGYAASALVLAAFSMQSMRQLRLTAIASNVAFLIYAVVGDLPPVFLLHGLLLPMNVHRLLQIRPRRPALTVTADTATAMS